MSSVPAGSILLKISCLSPIESAMSASPKDAVNRDMLAVNGDKHAAMGSVGKQEGGLDNIGTGNPGGDLDEIAGGDSGDFDTVFRNPLLLRKGVENPGGSNGLVGGVQCSVDICRVLIPVGVDEGVEDRDLDPE